MKALSWHGKKDIRCDTVPETTVEEWRRVIDVDLNGVFYLCRAAIPVFEAAGGGAIVTVSSAIGTVGETRRSAYCAAKAGVENLTRAMALDHGAAGIRANCVAPGLIDAGMSDAIYADPEVRRLRSGRVPLGRLGTAQDVAETVLFLGSEKAAYITGQTLAVDGGITRGALNAMPRARSDAPAD